MTGTRVVMCVLHASLSIRVELNLADYVVFYNKALKSPKTLQDPK